METSPALRMARDPTRHLHAKSLSSKWGTNSSAPPSPLLGEGRDEGKVSTTDHTLTPTLSQREREIAIKHGSPLQLEGVPFEDGL